MLLANLFSTFIAGLITPLTAVCVLALYPGFLSFLSSQVDPNNIEKNLLQKLAILVATGVLTFMALFGIIFSGFLKVSLNNVVGIVSPIAFAILIILSLLLIFDFDFSRFIPKIDTPESKNPKLNALLFGFYFGAIVLPCSPATIAPLFAISLLSTRFLKNFLLFIFFGIGMTLPLLLISFLPRATSQSFVRYFAVNKTWINRTAGIIMLVISLYYLIYVFNIFGM